MNLHGVAYHERFDIPKDAYVNYDDIMMVNGRQFQNNWFKKTNKSPQMEEDKQKAFKINNMK